MSRSAGGSGAGQEPGAGEPIDDAAARGVEALQAAAKEMITAARAALDVADGLVSDPGTARGAFSALTDLARNAAQAATTAAARGAGGTRGTGEPPDDGDGGGVQRIPVS